MYRIYPFFNLEVIDWNELQGDLSRDNFLLLFSRRTAQLLRLSLKIATKLKYQWRVGVGKMMACYFKLGNSKMQFLLWVHRVLLAPIWPSSVPQGVICLLPTFPS